MTDVEDFDAEDMDIDDLAIEPGDIDIKGSDADIDIATEALSRFDQGAIMRLTKETLQEVVDSEEINLPDDFLEKLAEELSVEGIGVYDNGGLGGRTTPSAAQARAQEVQEAHHAVAEYRGDEGRNMRGIKESKTTDYIANLEARVRLLAQQNNYFKASLLKMNEKIQ